MAIVTNTLDAAGQIGREKGNIVSRHRDTIISELLKCTHHVHCVLQDHGRSNQIVIAKTLLLLIRIILSDHVAAERKELREAVVRLDLVCLSRDRKSVVEGKSVSVRVDTGGRSICKKKTN